MTRAVRLHAVRHLDRRRPLGPVVARNPDTDIRIALAGAAEPGGHQSFACFDNGGGVCRGERRARENELGFHDRMRRRGGSGLRDQHNDQRHGDQHSRIITRRKPGMTSSNMFALAARKWLRDQPLVAPSRDGIRIALVGAHRAVCRKCVSVSRPEDHPVGGRRAGDICRRAGTAPPCARGDAVDARTRVPGEQHGGRMARAFRLREGHCFVP